MKHYRQYLDLTSVDLNLSANDPADSFCRLIDRVDEELSDIHENRRDWHDSPDDTSFECVRGTTMGIKNWRRTFILLTK
jgi:hypothetical protein